MMGGSGQPPFVCAGNRPQVELRFRPLNDRFAASHGHSAREAP